MIDIAQLAPLMRGLKLTLEVFTYTLIASIPLGLLFAFIQQKSPKIIRVLIQGYVYLFRGTPLLLQMMFVFFGLPFIGIVLDRFPAAIVTMIANYAAYFIEIFRGGLNSIPEGQYESLKVLSVKPLVGIRRVILPQLWQIVMPSVGNEVISLIKDTALVYVLGLEELLKVGRAMSNSQASLIPFVYVGVIYLIITGITTLVLRQIEHYLYR